MKAGSHKMKPVNEPSSAITQEDLDATQAALNAKWDNVFKDDSGKTSLAAKDAHSDLPEFHPTAVREDPPVPSVTPEQANAAYAMLNAKWDPEQRAKLREDIKLEDLRSDDLRVSESAVSDDFGDL